MTWSAPSDRTRPHTAAASSKLRPAGLGARGPRSGMHTNSARAPNRHALTPNSSSPAANSVTAAPAASTVPASSVPRILHLGRGKPLIKRLTNGSPARSPQSVLFTVVARPPVPPLARRLGDGELREQYPVVPGSCDRVARAGARREHYPGWENPDGKA